MSLIIYTTKEDTWVEKIKEYADFNNWSVSKAVRQILKAFVEVNMPDTNIYIPKEKPRFIEDLSDIKIAVPELLDSKNIAVNDEGHIIKAEEPPKLPEPEPPKIDMATFEAQILRKVNSNTNQDMETCIKEKTNDKGEVSCYFFDQGRSYHPFCIEKCWTRSDIWHERVRK